MNPAESAHEFFSALLGGNGELLSKCWITLTSITGPGVPPQTRWINAEVDRLASAAVNADQGGFSGVYIGVGLTRGPSPDVGRLTVEDVSGIAFLWVDIDFAGAGHDEKNPKPYVPNQETAIAVSRCLGLTPTVVTHTGHGIQAFYRLAEPWIFGAVDVDDDGAPIIDPERVTVDRARAKTLVWEFVTSIRIRARQLGSWYVDPVGDLARLMRVPGTHNRKVPGEELPVTVIENNATRFDLEQIEAVIAPRTLLDPYRVTGSEKAILAGVDLAGLWAEVKGAKGYLPMWLASLLESGWDEVLCRIWSGQEDARYHNNDSDIDMALVATILRLDLGVDKAAQAVMARRLVIGRKVEKVDPATRTDYLLDYTIPKVVARINAQKAAGETDDSLIDEVIAANSTAPTQTPEPLEVTPEPTTEVGPSEPTYNENTVSLHSEPENVSEPAIPLRRPEPIAAPEPEVEHAAAPRSPRIGMDPSIPGPPSDVEREIAKQLMGLMGLPPGVKIWAVGERHLEKNDEIRMWLVRGPESIVHGGRWRVGTVGSTRWHAKSDWEMHSKIAGIIWRDLHLEIEPIPQRAWRDDGRKKLYELTQQMEEGTPAEVVRLALLSMLRRAQGSFLFSTAVVTRDPWISEDQRCWIALDSVRQAISQSGFPVPAARALIDTLDRMGAKVQSDMAIVEDHRTVTDELTWVMLTDELFFGEIAEHVRLRATDRDAQDARSGIRLIGPS